MKRVLLVSLALAAFVAIPARAADMTPVPAGGVAPVYSKMQMTAAYDWTGFYLGGRGDYTRATTSSSTINTATGGVDTAGSTSTSSFHGGGQFGFDYMLPARVVIGIVADVTTGDDSIATFSNAAGTLAHTEESKSVAMGSVRARLGYALASILLYGTGGWAWSDGSFTRTQTIGKDGNAIPGTIESGPANLTGWTAGGGLAVGFWHNWEIFGEYRHTAYQSNNLVFPIAQRSTTSTTTANSIAGGVNFKFDPFITRY
jgi:opacity protein-like surface antigen